MRAAFAIAALAGSAFAAPQYGYGGYAQNSEVIETVTKTDIVVETVLDTVTVTDGYDATVSAAAYGTPAPTAVTTTTHHHHHSHSTTVVYVAQSSSAAYVAPASSAVYVAPAQSSSAVYVAPVQSSSAAYVAPAPSSSAAYVAAPKPTSEAPTPSSSQAPSGSSVPPYMAVVNKWRANMGKPALTHSPTLESNDLDCVTASNGQMVHKLNSGTFGQVLAPGSIDNFEAVFVGGWLCEQPSLSSELTAVCPSYASAWNYEGQTDHAAILSSTSYTMIGCSSYNGIMGCDTA